MSTRIRRAPKLSRPERTLLVTVAVAVALTGAYVALRSSASSPSTGPAPNVSILAKDYARETIYSSPQDPGYTSWTGAWIMPDRSLMTAFTQATGPVDPQRRGLMPPSTLRRMGIESWDPEWDFWGLSLSARYLRSTDGGRTWRPFRTDVFKGLYPHPYSASATIGLDDGTILRPVNGWDLRHDGSIPHTTYLQRLAPGAKGWSEPQTLLDPATHTYALGRIRRLRDGRLIATGNAWRAPAGSPPAALDRAPKSLVVMVSDDVGQTWTNGLTVPPEVSVYPNEWDTAELPNGDLLAVFRTREPGGSTEPVRRQGLLERRGAGWELTNVKDAPFPHSGAPELLATAEGAVLHIATSGMHYTMDGGATWEPLLLDFKPPQEYRSRYYPRAVQAEDGTIYVFAHDGGDDPYGEVDQAIVMDRFRLAVTRKPAGPG